MATGNHRNLKLPDLTPSEVMGNEAKLCEIDPIIIIKMGHLRIKNKKQELKPLDPNPIQMKVLDIIQDIRKKKKPIRLCILKGRQFGISTLMEAIIYAFATQWSNMNALIMSDDDDGSNYLFEMTKLYYEFMKRENPHLTPEKKVSNEKKLEFFHKRSQILIDTAKNIDAGRKYTFHFAHLSEAARFRDFDQTMLSLMQSVPDLPNTLVAIETTANGENQFSKFWWDICRDSETGSTDWVPIFLSWKDHAEYSKTFFTDGEVQSFTSSMTEEENMIMKTHGLTLEQMNWRRSTIKNKCGNNIEKFRQEYPLTAEEAFVTSGKRVFGEIFTKPQEKNIVKPKYVGELEIVDRRPTFMPNENGYLKIFKTPQKGHRYVVAADACAGIEGGDFACAQVLDRSTWEQVAILHGRIPPDLLGEKCYAIGCWYNWALMAPEVNRDGLVTVLKLRDLYYPNIVHRTKLNFDDVFDIKESDELGWDTNVKTKPILISDLREALTNMLVVIHDEDTLREIKKYSVLDQSESGYTTYGAALGSHDDRVIALAIAIHFAKTLPEAETKSFTDSEVHSKKRTGY